MCVYVIQRTYWWLVGYFMVLYITWKHWITGIIYSHTYLSWGVLFEMITSLALPCRRVLSVDLYPRVNFPLFITRASRELILSIAFFCKRKLTFGVNRCTLFNGPSEVNDTCLLTSSGTRSLCSYHKCFVIRNEYTVKCQLSRHVWRPDKSQDDGKCEYKQSCMYIWILSLNNSSGM